MLKNLKYTEASTYQPSNIIEKFERHRNGIKCRIITCTHIGKSVMHGLDVIGRDWWINGTPKGG